MVFTYKLLQRDSWAVEGLQDEQLTVAKYLGAHIMFSFRFFEMMFWNIVNQPSMMFKYAQLKVFLSLIRDTVEEKKKTVMVAAEKSCYVYVVI